MSELQQLMQNSIPGAREVLQDNYRNLLQVADYCESNYGEAKDKRKALEETMAFTTQSLASVAYQISNLASYILKMLDVQAAEIRKVEANVSCITQVVEMHKEKVARREIGTFAVCKTFPHYQKIISPARLEPLEAYYRKPLNFSSLDDIGHGIKDQSTQLARTGTLTRRGTKTGTGQSSGSLGRSHRTPEPIQPPIVPNDRLSSTSSTSSLRGIILDCTRFYTIQDDGPGRAEKQKMLQKKGHGNSSLGTSPGLSAPTEPPPPPPSLLSVFPPPVEADNLLPPPQVDTLPPPPATMDDMPPPDFPEPDLDFPASPPPPPLDVTNLGCLGPPLLPPPPPPEKLPWAPETYLEKVVTLYPYTQQKENELSFAEGAIIYVTRKYSDGWCEGVSSDAEGLFPENYVEAFY